MVGSYIALTIPTTTYNLSKGMMWTLSTCIYILFLVTMTFHGISATDKDDPNAEYFFGCSGGEFDKVKSLIEKDPSLGKKKLIVHSFDLGLEF